MLKEIEDGPWTKRDLLRGKVHGVRSDHVPGDKKQRTRAKDEDERVWRGRIRLGRVAWNKES